VEECPFYTHPFSIGGKRYCIAHAHPRNFEPFQGYICLSDKKYLKDEGTLLHEVAHLIACKFPWTQPHGKEFKKVAKEIGAPLK
jgi:SprT-like family protein